MKRHAQHLRLAVLLIVAFAHGMAYALLVPLWQAPDEPLLFEYAGLVAQLGRVPSTTDRSPALEAAILGSLERNQFWRYTIGAMPQERPQTIEDASRLFFMPRQVGGDPPAYFLGAALILELTPAWDIDSQARLLRVLNAALLPLVALCAYGVARELAPGHEAPALAAAGLVALQPMAAWIGAAIGNDSIANLLGALLCWWLVRAVAAGLTPRRLGLILLTLALGLLTKRTMLPYALLLLGLASLWGTRQIWGAPLAYRAAGAGAAALLVAGLGVWVAGQIEWGGAWGWYWVGSHQPATRVWVAREQRSALEVRAGQAAIYPLPALASDRIRGGTLRFGARVWGDGQARGQLIVLNDQKRHDIRFAVGRPQQIETAASVYSETRGVALVLQADSGTLYAGDLWAESGGIPLIDNSRLELPGIREGAPLLGALGYLRLPELGWTLTSGQLWRPLPSRWLELLFASFWGHFGWMNIAVVFGSIWAWVLGGFCLAGAAGLALALARPESERVRRLIWLLLALCGLAALLPVLNAALMPSDQVLQQGRYLFPVLAPFAALLATGQARLVPARWHGLWLAGWLAFLAVFGAITLVYVAGQY